MTSGKLIILHTQGLQNYRLQGLEDIKLLQESFKMYNCDVNNVYNIANKSGLENSIELIRNGYYNNFKYIAVAILTNDNRDNRIILSDGQFVNLELDVILPISNISCLATKPKLFIMEASRGFDCLTAKPDAIAFPTRRIPANLLRCYASKEGFEYRPVNGGSVYTGTFCELLKEKGKYTSIQEIHRLTSLSIENRNFSQIPCMEDNMTKPFILGEYV